MGAMVSRSVTMLFRKEEIAVVMLGLGYAGKTSIINKLKLGAVITTVATIGFDSRTVEYKNVSFIIWDVGGQMKIGDLLRHFFPSPDTQCIIYVVDSNDRDRIKDAKAELHILLKRDEIRNATLLVFANKQDLPNAMPVAEIADKLSLHSLPQSRWHIQPACAVSGEGLHEGLDWLCSQCHVSVKS